MRAVSTTYTCSPVVPPRDNREIVDIRLVDQPEAAPGPAGPGEGRRPPRKPAIANKRKSKPPRRAPHPEASEGRREG